MTHIAWGIIALALAASFGLLTGHWIGYERGYDRCARDEAEWKRKATRPAPARAPAPPETPHAGPGKHRHPPGPRHAAPPARPALPVAGYLPAPDGAGPWDGTITMPAQQPPWYPRPEEPEPVLEPTAVLPGPPETDTAWTRRRCAELQAYMDELIEQSEPYLKELTS
jgi:hypothetical protein